MTAKKNGSYDDDNYEDDHDKDSVEPEDAVATSDSEEKGKTDDTKGYDKSKKAQYNNGKSWKNVVNLGVISFFTGVSSEMVSGVFPIFIIETLGNGKGVLGFIEGIGQAAGYGSRTFSGSISDKIGQRKPLVYLGYGLSTLSRPIFALSAVWPHALFARAVDKLGQGTRTPPRDAMIGDSVSLAYAGRAFGINRTISHAGAIVGPLLGFFLIPIFEIRDIFWISIIPALSAIVILFFYIKDTKFSPRDSTVFSNVRHVLRGKYLWFLILLTVFSVGAFNYSFILVQTMELGLESALVPLVYVLINIAHTASGYPAGVVSDKFGAEKIVLVGFALFFVISAMGFASPPTLFAALVMASIFGVYHGVSITSQTAAIPKYVTAKLRGTAFGIYYLFVGAAFFVSNTVFGFLWDTMGSQQAYAYSMTLTGISTAGLLLFLVVSGKR